MQDPHNLRVTAFAESLAADAYIFAATLPVDQRFELRRQMRRAASSIPLNIYEGCGREGNRALLPFLHIALGSASELQAQLRLVARLHIGDQSQAGPLLGRTIHLKRMLARLIKAIRARLETESAQTKRPASHAARSRLDAAPASAGPNAIVRSRPTGGRRPPVSQAA
jgi:four helix bundle protein